MRGRLFGLALLIAAAARFSAPVSASEVALGTSGGIYTAPVQVNRSVTRQLLIDPGAGAVVIPVSVLRLLVRNGSVTGDDVIGIGTAQLADSSLYLIARVRLRELRIGDAIVPNVVAAVSPALTQPLLGQSFLRRFASVTFDNRRQTLILSNDAATATAQPPTTARRPPYPSYPPAGPLSGGGSPPVYRPGYGR